MATASQFELPRATTHARRARAAAALAPLSAVVLVGAGEPIGIPGGQDQTYPFVPHPDYRWLTGRDRERGIIAFDPRDGWVDFVAPVTEAERVWEGRVPATLSGTRSRDEFDAWIAARRGTPILALGAGVPVASTDADRATRAAEALLHARRPKDADELALIRRTVVATAAGFEAARAFARPGVTERAIQIETEAAMYRAGADGVGYSTLVGSGPNSSVLHFAPSSRVVRDGEFVLIDAGGAIGGYTSDITRTYVAGGRPEGVRKDVWDTVARTLANAIQRCRPGVEWRDVHRYAARDIVAGLVDTGIMRGNVESLVDRDASALFFPHGIGHMVGLGVRDAGGRRPGAPNRGPCCGVSIRVDLPLEVGYLMTVEPGIYFIDAILDDRTRRERFADCVDWGFVDRLRGEGIGGVRLEQNVLVTSGEPDVLTASIPL
ncbi:MAG: M24 family metallopeptidase [Phycisphaerae bacterium]|nr:M24 family metallopeptidase [Phycisphaerae bacterium]